MIIRTPLSRCRLGFFTPALVLCLSGFGTTLLALTHEATFAAKVAQETRFLNVFGKTLQEGIKTLTITQFYTH
jgi:ABC-type polar amino acid transport system ATPase subunit